MEDRKYPGETRNKNSKIREYKLNFEYCTLKHEYIGETDQKCLNSKAT